MILRTNGDLPTYSGLRLRRFRLGLIAALAALLITAFAGGSGAGISAYQGTLYFAGPASAIAGSYQLTTNLPAAQGTTPSPALGVAGSGGLAAGSYRWIYVTSSGGALTASAASNLPFSVTPANTPVLVSNVPVGADVYRATIPSSTTTGKYTFVGTNAGPTTTYTDTNTSTAGAALPQADTRVPVGATGWAPFVPGTSLGSSLANTSTSGTTPAIPGSCTGWTVDSPAGITFPAGTWTFNAQVRPDSTAVGAAVLTVAMWKVDTSGATLPGGTIVPVTDGGALTLNGMSQTVSVSYTTSSGIALDTNERLCVQFWRHQTAATNAGATRTVWMLAYDPNNSISLHPAPNTLPSAPLSSPADGTHTSSIPQLGASYSDAEADAGNITIRLCTDVGCSTPLLPNSGPLAVTNGATVNWTPPGPLGDATYYWQAQAQDAGGAAAWTSSRSFVLDTAAPVTSVNTPPPAQSNLASGTIGFSANESVTGFQCRIDGAAYAACTSPHAYGPLLDGPHTFDVKAVADLAGNAGASASASWTIDTASPDTSIVSAPSALSNSSNPSFDLSSTESGTFQCSLDGAAFAACADPATYSGLSDGAHSFQARALDAAGNPDPTPAAHAWTIDATPPDTSIGPSQPPALTTATGATFDFSSNEPGSFACRLDSGSFVACTTPKTYSGLADGSHTFSVRATDTASNTDPTPASYTWTVDTTAPDTAIGPTTPPANTSSSSATLDFTATEPGSTFECRLDGGAYGACATPATYSGLADGVHTFNVRATDPAGSLDSSPATYSWTIDNLSPATPTLVAPLDALMTNGMPQLRATFDDTTPGDTGSVEFQICSTAAPAGSACAPVVQATAPAGLADGDTASMSPTALPDGTYHWQARARDAAGNQSAWSATRSFQLDTSAPAVTLGEPADGAWVKAAHLTATFSKASFAGTGSVEFRLCSDALCLGVLKGAQTGQVLNGGLADWTPSGVGDGLYYWQARAHDSAGNVSAWSSVRSFTRDTIAPGKPHEFNGHVGADGLTLRWESPGGTIANYVVFVDGKPWKNLGSSEFEVKLGPFDENDARTFSVVATDPAGNVGAMSPVLVGVPKLVGLTFAQATSAASARGLELHHPELLLKASELIVASQNPEPSTLAEQGSAIDVKLVAAKGAPLVVRVKPGRVRSKSGAVLRLRIQLSAPAVVSNRLLNAKGRLVTHGRIGTLQAGTTTVRIKLPRSLRRGTYRLLLDAAGVDNKAQALVRVSVSPRKPA